MVTTERVSAHVRLIRGRLASGFVAIYAVVGRRVTVVDTGFARHPERAIAPALASFGLSLGDVDLILTTHGHPDHLGGHAAVARASNAPVAIHQADRSRLSSSHAHGAWVDEFVSDFNRLGLTHRATEREAMLVEAVGGSIASPRLLEDGERIAVGGDVFIDVLHSPGHTGGSVSFLVHPDGTMLVGDAIQGTGGGSGLPLYEDPDAYRSSLHRLGEVGASMVGMGHPFRSTTRTRHSAIVSRAALGPLLRESGSFPPIADELARESLASEPPTISNAVRAFLAGLPPPFRTIDTDLERVGAGSLHAALVHLDRQRRRTEPAPEDS